VIRRVTPFVSRSSNAITQSRKRTICIYGHIRVLDTVPQIGISVNTRQSQKHLRLWSGLLNGYTGHDLTLSRGARRPSNGRWGVTWRRVCQEIEEASSSRLNNLTKVRYTPSLAGQPRLRWRSELGRCICRPGEWPSVSCQLR
jgi:hypothetical protein